MSQSYYRYAERGADSQINWAEVGKSMVDMLNQEVQIREEKKAAIEEQTQKAFKEFANAPQGTLGNVNDVSLQLADDSKEQLLMADRLLKAGALKPKDYLLMRQNMVNGVTEMYDAFKFLNEQHKTIVDGIGDGTLSSANAKILKGIENLAMLKDARAYIDNVTGTISLSKQVMQNGVLVRSTAAGDTYTSNQVKNIVTQKYNKYQLQDEAKALVDTLGDIEKAEWAKGALAKGGFEVWLETASPAQRGQYDLWVQENAAAVTNNNPMAAMSILFDWRSEDYDITYDRKEFEKNNPDNLLVYIDKDTGLPELNDIQKGRAATAYRMALRSATSQKIDAQIRETPKPDKPTATEITMQKQKESQLSTLRLLAEYRTAPADRKVAIANNLVSSSGGRIIAFDSDDQGNVTLTDAQGNPTTYTMGTGEDWLTQMAPAVIPVGQTIDVPALIGDLDATVLGQKEVFKNAASSRAVPPPSFDNAYSNFETQKFDGVWDYLRSTPMNELDEDRLMTLFNSAINQIPGLSGIVRVRPFGKYNEGIAVQVKEKDAKGNMVFVDAAEFPKFDLEEVFTADDVDALINQLVTYGQSKAKVLFTEEEKEKYVKTKRNPAP